MDIAGDGREHDLRLLARARLRLRHVRLEEGDRLLHHRRRLEHERQLHLARAEELAHRLHAAEQVVVDDCKRRILLHRFHQALVEVAVLAVDDVLRESLLDREIGERLLRDHLLGSIGEERDEVEERIELLGLAGRPRRAAKVEDEPLRRVPLLGGDAVLRHDLRGVHDRGGEAALARVMQEHAVEHRARRRLQAERDVREAEDDAALREFPRDRRDAVERLEAEASVVVVAGRDREGQRIEEDVLLGKPPLLRVEVADARRDLKLARRGLRHAGLLVLVDRQRDARSAVLLQQRADAVHPLLAVLEVDRVDDRLSAVALQAFLDHDRVGRVEHDRRVHLAHIARRDLGHVLRAVAADEIDAHIEHLPAVLDLLAAHRDEAVEVAFVEQALELARAVGVRALGDDEERVLLLELDEAVEARAAGLLRLDRSALRLLVVAEPVDHRAQLADVLGRGAAATADRIHAVFLDEPLHRLAERLRAERILGASLDEDRKARVRQHADRAVPVLGDVRDMLGHLDRARRAVEAERVDRERLKRVHHRRDVRAEEHRARRLDRHAREDRAVVGREARFLQRVDAGVDRDLLLEKVLRSLDHEAVDAARDQAARLLEVARVHLLPRHLPERHELGARPHRADREARAAGGLVLRGRGARDLGRALVQLEGPRGELLVELLAHEDVGAERVGLDHIGARREVVLVDPLDDVGPALDEDVGAVVATEVVAGLAVGAGMDLRTHAAVKDEGAGLESLQERANGGHPARVRPKPGSFNHSSG